MEDSAKAKLSSLAGEGFSLAIALVVVLFLRTVAAEPFNVPSASMVPTLLVGDTLIAGKYTYGYSKYSSPLDVVPDHLIPNVSGRVLERPGQRGDVVVFKLPHDTSINYVKRLIGLPGDRIQMREGRLYINGELVPRRDDGTFNVARYGSERPVQRYIETLPGGHEHAILEFSDTGTMDDTPEFTVPAGHYFMMGDNRDDSLDSRVSGNQGGVGFVPAENLVGRVDRILYSRDAGIKWWQVTDLLQSFRGERFLSAVN